MEKSENNQERKADTGEKARKATKDDDSTRNELIRWRVTFLNAEPTEDQCF